MRRSAWASPTSGSAAPRSGCSPPPARTATTATTSASRATATRTTGTRARLRQRRRRPPGEGRPRRRLPRARPARRQGAGRPVRRRVAARNRRLARRRTPPAGGCGTATPLTAMARRPTAHPGRSTAQAPGPGVAPARPASGASTRSQTAGDGLPYLQTMAQHRQRRLHDPRAGLGPARARRRRRHYRPARDRLGRAAGLGDGPVRPPRAGHRRRPPGGDPGGRRAEVRARARSSPCRR